MTSRILWPAAAVLIGVGALATLAWILLTLVQTAIPSTQAEYWLAYGVLAFGLVAIALVTFAVTRSVRRTLIIEAASVW